MGSDDTRSLHTMILIPSVVLAVLATPLLALLPGFSGAYVFFYLCAITFLAAHWWTLAYLIESLFNDEKILTMLRGMITVFPVLLTFAIVFVAAKIDRTLLIPTFAGIVSITSLVALFCVIRGIMGLFFPMRKRIEA